MTQNPTSQIFFLGVGAQKSGTSWLSNYFKSHPEILMSPIKEMLFFGNRTPPNLKRFEGQLAFQEVMKAFTGKSNVGRVGLLNQRLSISGDISNYKAFFQSMLKSEKVYGEITPSYAFLDKNELAEIHKHFPKCRIIFLMRNPVDRAWSQMRFSHTKDTPSELHADALRRMMEQSYILRNDYKSTIEKLISVFPRDQIHFEFFEHLFTQNSVNKICDFLGVKHKKAKLEQKRNVAVKIGFSSELRQDMIKILYPQYEFANTFFKSKIPTKWHDDMKSFD